METVVIVIHLMVIIAMVAMVLLQRSEGGALGIGGGGGGFMSSRGQGNMLTRSTAILAAAFFATSIALTVLARMNAPPAAILDDVPTTGVPVQDQSVPGSGQGILDTLEGLSQPGQNTPPAPRTNDGTSIPTTPIIPAAPAEPQVPTSQ